jgi:hypothetical protein
VTDVRGQLPGWPGWVLLRNPDRLTVVNDDTATGCQPVTPVSGYAPSLPVLVAGLPGGDVDAMAARDARYSTSPGWAEMVHCRGAGPARDAGRGRGVGAPVLRAGPPTAEVVEAPA